MARQLDHLVYTVPHLETAMDDLEARLGVRPVFGGYHKTRGTKNALLKLNDGAYLEILAADDGNTDVPPPRWMGVDLLTGAKMTRWALKSDDLLADQRTLRATDPRLGEIVASSRKTADGATLKWSMILPLAAPEVDVLPFMVDWRESEAHPHDALPESGCGVISVLIAHPAPAAVSVTLDALGCELAVVEEVAPSLGALLRCPNGIVQL